MSSTSKFRYLPTFCILAFTGSVLPPISSGALAEDKTVDNDRTTAISTTNFLGASGKLTISESGTITTSGAPLTIDGNHTLLMQGTLTSTSKLSGIGLKVDTGDDLRLTSGIVIEGDIEVPGPSGTGENINEASENVGFGLFGTGVFDGDITLKNASTISVGGGNAKGLYIGSDLEGDLFMNGSIEMLGAGSIGVHIEGDVEGDVKIDGSIVGQVRNAIGVLQQGAIDGAFVHEGGINIGRAARTDADGDPVAAVPGIAAVYLTNDISGGVLFGGVGVNDNPDKDEVVPVSSITSNGGAPALLIENKKADGSDLSIGKVSGVDFGIVHKGTMAVNGSSSEVDAWGIRILGGEGDAWTRVAGGLHIDKGRVDVATLDAVATAVEIGERADVPVILNRGIIESTSGVTDTDDTDAVKYSEGGDAIGVLVQEGSNVTTFRNTGTIFTSAAGEGKNSVGLVDLSGNITNISNTGTWVASLGTGNEDGSAVVIDVRANTSGVRVVNEGAIIGDIWLGSGDDTVQLKDGELDGDISFGAGANRLVLEGDAIFSGGVSHAGTLDLTMSAAELSIGTSDNFNVTTATLDGESTLYFTIDPVQDKAGKLNATGTVVIGDDVEIAPIFRTFVTEEKSYDIINAGSLVLGGDMDTPTLTSGAFIFNTSLSLSEGGNGLTLTVRPKTAEELSLTGNKATIYEGLLEGLPATDDLGGALATLENEAEVNIAMESILPDTTNAMFQMVYSGVRQFEATLNDRLVETTARRRLQGGFWAREIVGLGSANIVDSDGDADYLGAGIMIGFDKNISDSLLWGISTGFMLQGTDRTGDVGDDVSLFTPYVSTYAIASNGAMFISGSASFWYNSVTRDRALTVGSLTKLVDGSSSGWTGTADAHVGYDLQLGGLHLRPKVGISYIRTKESSYIEDGAVGAALEVDGRSFNRLDGVGSVALGHDFKWKGKGDNAVYIRPELTAAYRKRLGGTSQFITNARFLESEEIMVLTNDAISDTSYELGGSLNIFSGFGAASLRYTYEKRDEWTTHFAGFNFKMEF